MTTSNSAVAPHLWEINHPDRCEEGNYYHAGLVDRFKSWGNFLDHYKSFAESTLLFRWDWRAPRRDGEFDQPILWQGDENYRDCELCLHWMGQHKGAYFSTIVDVCRSDEPEVKAWLRDRFAYLVQIWEPFFNGTNL